MHNNCPNLLINSPYCLISFSSLLFLGLFSSSHRIFSVSLDSLFLQRPSISFSSSFQCMSMQCLNNVSFHFSTSSFRYHIFLGSVHLYVPITVPLRLLLQDYHISYSLLPISLFSLSQPWSYSNSPRCSSSCTIFSLSPYSSLCSTVPSFYLLLCFVSLPTLSFSFHLSFLLFFFHLSPSQHCSSFSITLFLSSPIILSPSQPCSSSCSSFLFPNGEFLIPKKRFQRLWCWKTAVLPSEGRCTWVLKTKWQKTWWVLKDGAAPISRSMN